MNCTGCGQENPDHAKFCVECGRPFEAACARCQTALPAGAKFCLECGAPVAGDSPAASAQPAAVDRSPADYTPRHLAEKILHSRSALEGERKQVTVLFADVKGSMELASQLDPETWHGILDDLFHILSEGVHRFEGTVNQYTGDGIMALFGAPIAHEDHAQRACYAALHLAEAVRRHALEVRRRHGLDVALRLGINSGEVVVGKIGDDLRMDYTAAGHSVGLAQRMETLAEAGACYLTDATARLVAGYFELEDLGEFDVKGVGEPVRVHKLLGMGGARTRFDVSRNRGLTRFVGRAADVQILDQALDRARSGQGAVLGIIAEAGTGKSRLCFEFAEACRARGYTVTEGQAVAHGKSIPLIPVLEVFRDYFGIGDRDDPRSAREKIAGRLLLLDADFRDALPVIFEFLGVGDPDAPAPPMDPEARQRRLFGVSHALLKRSTAERPGILMIEDLHWLDGSSEVWVRNWVDAVAGTHNLLLLNSRPEYHADWMQRSHYQQLALAPLGPDAIRELLAALIGSDPSTAGLGHAIYERTRGNPFFAEEVVRTLIESGHLIGAPGAYKLAGPVDELRVPDSVQALLAARIDRLVDRTKRLLQIAAVIGKEFREPVLARVAGLATQDLGEVLAQLRDAEFVYEQSLYPVAEYAFKHPLTQEVALASQLQDARRRTHAEVARAIEDFDADRLDEQAATLAHHWEQAGEGNLAATWHARAAQWAMRTDTEEAYRHWTRVLELAQDGGAEVADLLGRAYVALVNLGWRSGRSPDDTRATFEAGRRLFEAKGDRRSLALLISNYSLVGGVHASRRVEYNREALALAEQHGDLTLRINVGVFTFPLLYGGLLREAHERANACIELIEANAWAGSSLIHFDPHRWIYSARGWSHCLLGDIASGVADSDRGIELARRGDSTDLLFAENLRATLDGWRGEFGTALQHARRQFDLSEELGGSTNGALGSFAMGTALCGVGRWAEALPLLEVGFARARENESYMMSSGLALALLHCGEEARALDVAREGAAYCASQGNVFSELDHQIDLARVAAALGELAEARSAAERARELAERMECRMLLPRVQEAEAEVAAAAGDAEERLRLLRAARDAFEALGAAGHVRRLAEAVGG